jgi:hypothetical protein
MKNTNIAHVNNINIQGSSRIGFLTASLEDLVSLLGCPVKDDRDQHVLQWKIAFEDGRTMMIESWKTSSQGMGLRDWHVWGREGRRQEDLKTLEAALNLPVVSNVNFFSK